MSLGDLMELIGFIIFCVIFFSIISCARAERRIRKGEGCILIQKNKQVIVIDPKSHLYGEGDNKEEAWNNLIEKLKAEGKISKEENFISIRMNKQFVIFEPITNLYGKGDNKEEALNNLIKKMDKLDELDQESLEKSLDDDDFYDGFSTLTPWYRFLHPHD